MTKFASFKASPGRGSCEGLECRCSACAALHVMGSEGVDLFEVAGQQIRQLPSKLDPRWPAPYDDDVQQPLPFLPGPPCTQPLFHFKLPLLNVMLS